MTEPESQPTDEIRGTILVCDHIYRAEGGKFVIAGTYTGWETTERALILYKLDAYVRLQVEHARTYALRILLVQRNLPPTHHPILRAETPLVVKDPLMPIELGLRLPRLTVKCPVTPHKRAIGQPVVDLLTLWLEVDGKAIASTPLLFKFYHPRDPRHAEHQQKPPSHGGNPS